MNILTEVPTYHLSDRQLEVSLLIADGLHNPEIGDRLGVNTDTVKTHVAGALRKAKANDRAHLTLLLLRAGVIGWNPVLKRHVPRPSVDDADPRTAVVWSSAEPSWMASRDGITRTPVAWLRARCAA